MTERAKIKEILDVPLTITFPLAVVLAGKLLRGDEGNGVSGIGDLLHHQIALISVCLDLFLFMVGAPFHVCRVFNFCLINHSQRILFAI